MDSYITACRIMDLLVQSAAADDPVFNLMRNACHERRWHEVKAMIGAPDNLASKNDWEQAKTIHAENLSWSYQTLNAAYDLVRGVCVLAQNDLQEVFRVQEALKIFQKISSDLKGVRDGAHVRLVALFALGLTHKLGAVDLSRVDSPAQIAARQNDIEKNRARSAIALRRAERLAFQLAQQSDTESARQQQSIYQKSVRMIDAIVAGLNDDLKPRLIPVVEGTAGELRYIFDDDFATTEPVAIAVGAETQPYRLLRYQDRTPIDSETATTLAGRMISSPQYFLFDVDGDSMDGIGAHIRHGDRLLVLHHNDWNAVGGEPAVVKIEDTKPRVKFVRIEGRTVTLHSANPRYAPEVYARKHPAVTLRGTVKAILEAQ